MKRKAWFLAVFAALGALLLTACTDSEGQIAQDVRNEAAGDTGASGSGNVNDAGTQEQAGEGQSADENAQPQSEAQTQSPEQTEPPQTESTQAAPAAEDIWTGTYASEQETVTLTLADEKSLSFAFANSGIASTAEISGTQAVYQGDDHHVIVFEMNEGVLNVAVTSEEDFDASASPLNGTYVRQN